MEINNENKEKFFAQYWKQEVLTAGDARINFGNINHRWESTVYEFSEQKLSLKPLSSISDEDKSVILSIHWKSGVGNDFSNPEYIVRNMNSCSLPMLQTLEISDYLRSKGYALPWMGLSVDELIECGWIKIKNP